MERLNQRMAEGLSEHFDVTVLSPWGSTLSPKLGLELRVCPFRGVGAFLIWSTILACLIARRTRASWVLGGSGLVAPAVWVASRVSRARSALYLHGLDIVVRSVLYRAVWLPLIRRVDRCIVNSRNTRELAVAAGVDPGKLYLVFPGVDLPEANRNSCVEMAGQRFRTSFGLDSGPILLSVGRMTKRKGLAEFVYNAMPQILRHVPNAQLVIVGDNAPDALHKTGSGQRQRVLAAAQRAGVENSVRLIGSVSESDLEDGFVASRVHVFPGIQVCGDVEGFGMVCIEAAARGLPTVAFEVGGVSDAIDDPVSGSLVAPADYASLVAAIINHLSYKGPSLSPGARAFAERFAWHRFQGSVYRVLTDEA